MSKLIKNRSLISRVSPFFSGKKWIVFCTFSLILLVLFYVQDFDDDISILNISAMFIHRVKAQPAEQNRIHNLEDFIGYSDWDKMCVILAYTPSDMIKEVTGSYYEDLYSKLASDNYWAIILIRDKNIVKEIIVDMSIVGTSVVDDIVCEEKNNAKFRIENVKYSNISHARIMFIN